MRVTVDEENSFVDSLGSPAVLQYTFSMPGRYTGQASLRCQPHLCQNCNRNQSLKIQELNYFTPSRESNYEAELKQHKCVLEDKYKLCTSCREVVGNHLKKQAGDLKTFLLNSHLQQSKSTPTKVLPVPTSPMSCILLLVNILCVFLASLLLCSDSLAKSKSACVETSILQHFHWNSTCDVFWSCVTNKELRITGVIRNFIKVAIQVTGTTSFTKGILWSLLEYTSTRWICLCSHTQRRYLLVAVMCLLLQLLIFLKRKTRAGVVALLCWTLLCVLSAREVYWSHSTTKFRVVTVCLCWVLTASYLLFFLYLYFGMLRKKKKKRICIAQSKDCRRESSERDSKTEGPNTASKSHVSAESTAGELDCNLNAMSLGLPRERSKIQDSHLSAVNHETGWFWDQNSTGNLSKIPLVSMRQRPLIVPAKLQFSGLGKKSEARCLPELRLDPSHSETNLFSSDDEDSSDSMEVDNSMEHHRKRSSSRKNDTRRTQGHKTEENSTCGHGLQENLLSSKLRIFAVIFSVRSFLLLASLLVNLYFIAVYTEWPSRTHRLLSKVFRR